jgi:hypothetical protein
MFSATRCGDMVTERKLAALTSGELRAALI